MRKNFYFFYILKLLCIKSNNIFINKINITFTDSYCSGWKITFLLIKSKNIGERIDIFLSKNIEKLSRSSVKKLINQNHVHLNNVLLNSASVKLKKNDK